MPATTAATAWHTPEVVSAKAAAGTKLTKKPDGSILASDVNPEQDVYTITTKANLGRIRALRR